MTLIIAFTRNDPGLLRLPEMTPDYSVYLNEMIPDYCVYLKWPRITAYSLSI